MKNIKQSLTGMILLCAFSSTVLATPIFNDVTITGDTNILNTGTLIKANNLGSGAAAATVNGVTFGNDGSGLSNFSLGGGDFSTDPFSSDLDSILSSLVFSPNTSTATLTIGGLIDGQDYRLQLLVSNDVNSTGENQFVTVQGATHQMTNWRTDARNLIVQFSAVGSSITASFNDAGYRTVLNGYALHDLTPVPAPLSLGLLCLGLIGLAKTRRKLG